MADSPDLAPWLSYQITANPDDRYRHGLVTEDLAHRQIVLPRLKHFVETIHSEVKEHWRNLVGISLDPLQSTNHVDPAWDYPAHLPMQTLQGYFGEIMAGIYAERNAPHGISGWEVPAYPFTRHQLAYEHLEKSRQIGTSKQAIVGQSGEDCLAFICNQEGQITHCLVCEAKCTLKHDSRLISNAHEALSEQLSRPVSLMKLIEILKDRKDAQTPQWLESLRQFYHREPKGEERYDLVMYVCGQHPKTDSTWMSCQSPHSSYQGGRRLEAVEIHLSEIESLIHALYDKSTP